MQELTIFENETFGAVRTALSENGVPLFCANDVAKALGYSNHKKAIRTHCKGGTDVGTPTPGGIQNMKYIPEPDIYRLVIKSQLPAAEQFEKWIFEEVLPTIRKYGGYLTPKKIDEIFENSDVLDSFLANMMRLNKKNKKLEKECEQLAPKAEYFDNVIDAGLLINFRTTAKEFGIPPAQLIDFLLSEKYLFRDTKKRLHPMQTYVRSGVFEMKEFCRNRHVGFQTLITPKGRLQIMDALIVAGLFVPRDASECSAQDSFENDILY